MLKHCRPDILGPSSQGTSEPITPDWKCDPFLTSVFRRFLILGSVQEAVEIKLSMVSSKIYELDVICMFLVI